MPRWDELLNHEFFSPERLSGAIIYFVLFLLAAWFVAHALRLLITNILARDQRGLIDRTALTFLLQLGRIVIYIVALILYAHLVPPLRAFGTALLAGVSVASVVLGIAAQSTLGNLIAGFSLLIYRPFRLGDRVQLSAPTGLETGVVENLTLGYTVLATGDNRRIVVPNSVIMNTIMLNLTSVDPRLLVSVSIGVGYSANLPQAREILLRLAQAHPSVQEVTGCQVTALGNSSVTLTVRGWVADSTLAKPVEFDLYEQAKAEFDQAGIEIPYPYTNVIVMKEGEGVRSEEGGEG